VRLLKRLTLDLIKHLILQISNITFKFLFLHMLLVLNAQLIFMFKIIHVLTVLPTVQLVMQMIALLALMGTF
jgi:hypothetical protein